MTTRRRSAQTEKRAQEFQGRRRGYYVLNPETDLAVAGPYDVEIEAQAEAARRNAIYPTLDKLVVRLLTPDHPGRGSYRRG